MYIYIYIYIRPPLAPLRRYLPPMGASSSRCGYIISYHIIYDNHVMDSLRGSSVKIGTTQIILAWPLRKDDTHKSRSVNNIR